MESGPLRFGDIEKERSPYESSRVIILPVPMEETATYLKGTARGPAAILQASANMELYDEELRWEPWRVGIFTHPEVKGEGVESHLGAISKVASRLLSDGKFIVALGGEHTLTLGLLPPLKERFGDLTVLQLDAHADLRYEYEGNRLSHACVMRRIREMGLRTVQAGIRSMSQEEADCVSGEGASIFYAREIRQDPSWPDKVIESLGERVYLTIDVDFFDPSCVPATGTPEPGGFSWYETLDFLKKLAEQRELVGADVVELCPKKGDVTSDFLAAKLVYKIIGYTFHPIQG